MNKQDLINRLLALPAEIATAEDAVLDAHSEVIAAKGDLQFKEDDLWITGLIDGKNAEIRGAQLRERTVMERQALTEAELVLKQAAVRLERFKAELSALRAVAYIIGDAA